MARRSRSDDASAPADPAAEGGSSLQGAGDDATNAGAEKQLTSGVSDSAPDGGVTKDVTLFNPTGAPEMPSVEVHAVDAARNEVPQTAGATDAPQNDGSTFDPAIHEAGPDGKGVRTAAGVFRRKRGGGGKSRVAPKAAQAGQPPQAAQDSSNLAKIESAALVSAGLIFTVGRLVGGPEFEPIVSKEDNEPETMKAAFAEYYRIKGVADIPPGLALTLVCMGYVGKRWNAPVFKERRVSIWERTKNKFGQWWLKRQERKLDKEDEKRRDKSVNRPGRPDPAVADPPAEILNTSPRG